MLFVSSDFSFLSFTLNLHILYVVSFCKVCTTKTGIRMESSEHKHWGETTMKMDVRKGSHLFSLVPPIFKVPFMQIKESSAHLKKSRRQKIQTKTRVVHTGWPNNFCKTISKSFKKFLKSESYPKEKVSKNEKKWQKM